jgi:transposase
MNESIDEAVNTVGAGRALPDPEVAPPTRATRRRFGIAQKARILALVDACAPGEQGHVLRREGVYASQLPRWRALVERNVRGVIKRGPKRRNYDELVKENNNLRKQVRSYERKTAKFELIIDVQKKMSILLNSPLTDDEQSEQNS